MEFNYPLSFLKAKTPEALRELMKTNNRVHGRKFHYENPQFVKGEWYVWFELKEDMEAEVKLRGIK